MRQNVSRQLARRWVTALALAVALVVPTASARADQQATTIVQLESPASGSSVGTRLMVNGWAADPSGQGAGVDAVRVYLGDPNSDGQDLGAATYGQSRPDVARTLGDSRFTNSGFELAVELPAGSYTVSVYAHRSGAGPDEGWAVASTSFTASASVRPDPRAVALLGGDQPQVRTAAPPTTSPTAAMGGGRSGITGGGAFSVTNDDGAIRTTVSRTNDPIPLDPIVPGMSSAQGTGAGGAELADPTGSGAGIRRSVASDPIPGTSGGSGQYSTRS